MPYTAESYIHEMDRKAFAALNTFPRFVGNYKRAMNKTIDYYNQNADVFASDTIDVEFTEVQDKFLSYLLSDSYILDFGCGSGRDTKYFLSKDFQVDAADGSEELCKIAEKTADIPVKQMLFSELGEVEKYDGIWACSSILHLPKDELKDVMSKMIRAIKNGGYIYTSFKYGDFEGYRNGRYFTDFTEDSFAEFLKDFPQLMITEEWISRDIRPGRSDEKWLNLILKKSDTV